MGSKLIPLDKVLVENSNYDRGKLKKRLLQAGLLRNECYDCGQLPEWNNKPLILHIEHINGVGNDNRIDNLAMLCPNCHSQTETYGGRNTVKAKTIKFCGYCSQPLDNRKSKYHKECYNEKRRQPRPERSKIDWPPVEEIRQRLDQSNFLQLSKELGVSDNAIRRHLATH